MKILYCAAEAAPIVKIGGLGDVAGSLPKALQDIGIDASCIIPHYATIDNEKWGIKQVGEFSISFGTSANMIVTISSTFLPGSKVPLYLLGNEHYIASGGVNAFEGSVSEIDRFAFFQEALVEGYNAGIMREIVGMPDIIHLNDWHMSLLPTLFKNKGKNLEKPTFVLTIHNLAYQGITDLTVLDKLHLTLKTDEALKWDAANNDIDFLLQGIINVDAINTVSENYAKEILTEEFCEGLCEILNRRKERLFGILNGIDYDTWNPGTDKFIAKKYAADSIKEAKAVNKKALQDMCGLSNEDMPIIGFVGRIEPKQKGIDLIYDWLKEHLQSTAKSLQKNAVDSLPAFRPSLQSEAGQAGRQNPVNLPFQFVLLGTGDKVWEEKFGELAKGQEESLSVQLKFDEHIAHAIYAGCDYILMPSRFEPGGLPQMIAQHYGTPPIVHAVGGLKDTVEDGVTGFAFDAYSWQALAEKVVEALTIANSEKYYSMAQSGMRKDYSWAASAKKYLEFYAKALSFAQNK